MFRPHICFAEGTASGDVRQQIGILINEVRSQPANPVPLLKLTHACAQLWIKTQQADLPLRIVGYLDRAVTLDNGQYARQIRQLIDGVLRQAEARQLDEPVAKLKDLVSRMDAKTASPSSEPESSVTPPPSSTTVPPPPAEEPPPATETPRAPAPETETSTPESSQPPEAVVETLEESVEPEVSAPEERMAEAVESMETNSAPSISETKGKPENPTPSEGEDKSISRQMIDDEVLTLSGDIQTVLEPAPDGVEDEELSPHDRRAMQRDLASAHAEAMVQVQKMFKEGRVYDIIRSYATVSNIRVKKHIIEGLAEHLNDWHIEPLLAVGAVERDEAVFRHILRVLLRHDRVALSQQIQIDNYSPDLLRVAAAVLGELGVRSAVPKLGRCLTNADSIVRENAAKGLGRLGEAASQHIPVLVELLRKDPKVDVRQAAAKALNAINTKEAYEAFETAANNSRFDEVIYGELDQMRARYGEDYKKTPEKGKKKSAGDNKNAIMYAILAAVFLGLLYYAWTKGWLGGAPPAE